MKANMTRSKGNPATDFQPRIAGFVCNWSAYSAVEMAGASKEEYPPNIRLVKVACLGRLHPGLILKAFELGADGVVLLGCPPDDCHYEFGMAQAKEVFAQTIKLLNLLGIDRQRLALLEMPLGRGDHFSRKVTSFTRKIRQLGLSPLSPAKG
jgi:F420-non-reducing hydrogenase iron-sulfur subunit